MYQPALNFIKNHTSQFTFLALPQAIWALGFCSFFIDIATEMITVTMPLYLSVSLGLSVFAIGVYDGLYSALAVLFKLVTAAYCDRTQQHKLLAGSGYALSSMTKLGLALFNTHFAMLMGLMLVDRLGKGIRTSPRDALIALNSPTHKYATYFSVHRFLDRCGAMLGPIAAFLILFWLPDSYQTIFLISFILSLLGCAIFLLLVPTSPTSHRQNKFLWRSVFQQKAFVTLLTLVFLLTLCSLSQPILYLIILKNTSLAPHDYPLLFSGSALVYCCFVLPIGRLADQYGKFQIYLLGYSLLFPLYLILAFIPLQLTTIACIILFIGLHTAATDGVLSALVAQHAQQHQLTSHIAVATSLIAIAKLISATCFTALWQFINLNVALYCFIAATFVLLFVICTQYKTLFESQSDDE